MNSRLPSFPLIIAAVLALSTWWLQYVVSYTRSTPNSGEHGMPDAIVENAHIDRFDAKGKLDMNITARTITHFPEDDSAELIVPVVRLIGNERDSQWRSEKAQISSGGDKVLLSGNVRGTRAAFADQPAMTLNTNALTLLTHDEIARTNEPVVIQRGASRIDASGLEWNNLEGTLVLQQVTTTLPNGKP